MYYYLKEIIFFILKFQQDQLYFVTTGNLSPGTELVKNASVNFQRHSKDIQDRTFVETFKVFPTPVTCLLSFSCFYIPMNTINNENPTLITVLQDIQILPGHSYFTQTFNFNSFRMSPRTFKSCPDIQLQLILNVSPDIQILPGHS